MHQGWKTFMQGYGSGLFTLTTIILTVRHDSAAVLFALAAILLFWFGGLNAEKLR